jgi:hypothetical protein
MLYNNCWASDINNLFSGEGRERGSGYDILHGVPRLTFLGGERRLRRSLGMMENTGRIILGVIGVAIVVAEGPIIIPFTYIEAFFVILAKTWREVAAMTITFVLKIAGARKSNFNPVSAPDGGSRLPCLA